MPRKSLISLFCSVLLFATTQMDAQVELVELGRVSYSYNGGNQTFVAPAGTELVRVKIWGAGGGGGFFSAGGGGGYVEATIAATAGQSFTISVGGPGRYGTDNPSTSSNYDAGYGIVLPFNGGGGTWITGSGGQGGGYSLVQAPDGSTIIAGGGGGGGDNNGAKFVGVPGGGGGGGRGGGPDGGTGGGSSLGRTGADPIRLGGGGGGGWVGGGGSVWYSGGGGGSNGWNGSWSVSHSLTGGEAYPANYTDGDLAGNAFGGGSGGNGSAGRITVVYLKYVRPPTVSWANIPSGVYYGSSHLAQAQGNDADGNLTRVIVQQSINGGGWSTMSDDSFSGRGSFTSGGGAYTVTAQPGSYYTFRALAIDSLGADSGWVTSGNYPVINRAPAINTTVSTGSIEFGQSVTITSVATDPDGNLAFHGIIVVNQAQNDWYRPYNADHSTGWGNHTPTNYLTASYSSGVTSGFTSTRTATYVPFFVGATYVQSNTHDNYVWAQTGQPYAYFTVNKAAPWYSFADRSFTGSRTLTADDLYASFWNGHPYGYALPGPTGTVQYNIISASGAGSNALGPIGVGTVLRPGSYVVRAYYPGDANYTDRIADSTFTVTNVAPTASLTLNMSAASVGDTVTATVVVNDSDGNFDYSNLWVLTPNYGWRWIRADNSLVSGGSLDPTYTTTPRGSTGTFYRTFTFTLDQGFGNYAFSLAAVDQLGARVDAATQYVSVANRAPTIYGSVSATTIEYGQDFNFSSTFYDPDGNAYAHGSMVYEYTNGNYVRPNVSYSRTGWDGYPVFNGFYNLNFSDDYCPGFGSTRTGTFLPRYAGAVFFHANGHDGQYWTNPSVVIYITINPSLPNSSFPNRSFTGSRTLQAGDLNATYSNRYSSSGLLSAPTGTTSYSIVSASGGGANALGAIGVGTVLKPGTYTIRASYSGDSNYQARTTDAVFTVSNTAPSASLSVNASSAHIGDTVTITISVSDSDANFDYTNLWVLTPNYGWRWILADNSLEFGGALDPTYTATPRGSTGTFYRTYTFTLDQGFGNYAFSLAAMDQSGARVDAATQYVSVANRAPIFTASLSATTISFGQSVSFSSAMFDADGGAYSHAVIFYEYESSGYLKPNVSYPRIGWGGFTAWSGFTGLNFVDDFSYGFGNTLTGTFKPRVAGLYAMHSNGSDGSLYGDPAVWLLLTVNKATPTINGLTARTFTAPYTLTAGDLSANSTNPYDGSSVQTTLPFYRWNGSSWVLMNPGDVLSTGSYSILADSSETSTHTYASRQVTWTVNPGTQAAVSITPTSATYTAGRTLTFSGSGGTGAGALTWNGSAGTSGASGTGTSKGVTLTATGTQTISVYRAGDANYNPSNTAQATVTVIGAPSAAVSLLSSANLYYGQNLITRYQASSSTNTLSYFMIRVGAGSNLLKSTTRAFTYTDSAAAYFGGVWVGGGPFDETLIYVPREIGTFGIWGHARNADWDLVTPNAEGDSSVNLAGGYTLNKATAAGSFANRALTSSGGSVVVSAGDLAASFANPYNTADTVAPSGAITYAIAPGSPNGTPGTAVTTATSLTAGLTYIVRATTAADTYYNLSTVDSTFTVSKSPQTISFGGLPDKDYGDAPFTVSASASSGLSVTFTVISGPATISGSTVTLTAAGSVTIRASQAGNVSWNAAHDVDRTFTVNRATQAINFPAIADTPVGASASLAATLSNAATNPTGSITYSIIGNTGGATGTILPATVFNATGLGVGNPGVITIQATYAGDANNYGATNTQTVNVPNRAPSASGTPPASIIFGASVSIPVTITDLDGNANGYSVQIFNPISATWSNATLYPFAPVSSQSDTITHTPTGAGDWRYAITGVDQAGVSSVTVIYTVPVTKAPTTTTAGYGDPSASINQFVSDSFTLSGTTKSNVTNMAVGSPIFTVTSITNISGASITVGQMVSSPFTIGGTVTGPGGVADTGQADAVGVVVLTATYPRDANYLMSSTTIAIPVVNATFTLNVRARAYPTDPLLQAWLLPSAVKQDTFIVRRPR